MLDVKPDLRALICRANVIYVLALLPNTQREIWLIGFNFKKAKDSFKHKDDFNTALIRLRWQHKFSVLPKIRQKLSRSWIQILFTVRTCDMTRIGWRGTRELLRFNCDNSNLKVESEIEILWGFKMTIILCLKVMSAKSAEKLANKLQSLGDMVH